MKKIDVRNYADYFGKSISVSKISDKETRFAIVRLYTSLSQAAKKIADEIEEMRKTLVGDKEEDAMKYVELIKRSENTELTQEERDKAVEEANSMEEIHRIDKDFQEMTSNYYSEDFDTSVIKKVPLEVLYEALVECNFPNFVNMDPSLSEIENIFAGIIE